MGTMKNKELIYGRLILKILVGELSKLVNLLGDLDPLTDHSLFV